MESSEIARVRIIEKFLKDPGFRRQLLADPKTVIEQETGQKYPEGIRVQAIETDPDVIVFPVPKPATTGTGAEITEKELDSISGGIGYTLLCSKGTGCLICFFNR